MKVKRWEKRPVEELVIKKENSRDAWQQDRELFKKVNDPPKKENRR